MFHTHDFRWSPNGHTGPLLENREEQFLFPDDVSLKPGHELIEEQLRLNSVVALLSLKFCEGTIQLRVIRHHELRYRLHGRHGISMTLIAVSALA
jgi:hypothetical protein